MLAILVYLSLVAACVVVGMTYGRWSVGSCCGCTDCRIQSGFASADWTGSGWTFSGTTATGSGYATGDTSTVSDYQYAEVAIDSALSVGNKIRVFVRYVDDDNYLYAEVEQTGASASTLRLGNRASGVDSTLDSASTSTAQGKTLAVCIVSDAFWAFKLTGSLGAVGAASYPSDFTAIPNGTQGGIWSNASCTLSGYQFNERGGDCPSCFEINNTCSEVCTGDTMSRHYAVTFPFFTDVDDATVNCPMCENYADVTMVYEQSPSQGCTWLNLINRTDPPPPFTYDADYTAPTDGTCVYLSTNRKLRTVFTLFVNGAGNICFGIEVYVDTATVSTYKGFYEWDSGVAYDGGSSRIDCLGDVTGVTLTRQFTVNADDVCQWPDTLELLGPV